MEGHVPSTVGIVGCGYVGSSVLHTVKQQQPGVRVEVTTTSPDREAELRQVADAVSVVPPAASGDDAEFKSFVARQEALLVAVAPKSKGPADADAYRRTYVDTAQRVVDAVRGKRTATRVVWLSSTSVYGAHDGGVTIDETTPPLQPNANQQTLKQAEDILLAVAKENPLVHVSILRLSGIWGPGRMPGAAVLRRFQPNAAVLPAASASGWINLVHLEDITAAALAGLGVESTPGQWPFGVLNVSGCTVRRRELYDLVAKREGLPPPVWSEGVRPEEGSAGRVERGGNKKIDSSRLLGTGFVFKRADVLFELSK